jgi:hypothetical protein
VIIIKVLDKLLATIMLSYIWARLSKEDEQSITTVKLETSEHDGMRRMPQKFQEASKGTVSEVFDDIVTQ